jgi:hypothetical protein
MVDEIWLDPPETERRTLLLRALLAATFSTQQQQGSKNGKKIRKHGKDRNMLQRSRFHLTLSPSLCGLALE